MKKYFLSVFIPYLLFHLSGCYSMQKVTKGEYSSVPGYPELHVRTKDKQYTFKEDDYYISYDTIYGRGKITILKNAFEPFEGKISIKDVESIERNESDNNSEVPELLVTTKDTEFIFKSELNSYLVKNDNIYGKGKYRPRYFENTFEGALDFNEAEYIEVNKFNSGATIALISILFLSVVVVVAMISSFKMEYEDMWRGIGNVHP